MSRSWKASERAVAKLLGGQRVPVNGRARGSAPDVLHSWLAIECKSWRNLPTRILTGMIQAEASARWSLRHEGKSKLPLLVLHHDHHDHHDDLVVLRLGDFIEYFVGTIDGITQREEM